MASNAPFVSEGVSYVLMNSILLHLIPHPLVTVLLLPCGPLVPIYTTGHTHQRCSTTRVPCGRGCHCTCRCLCCPMPGVRDLEVHVVPASPLAAAETIGAMPRVPVTVLSIGWKSTGVLRSQNKSTLNWLSSSKRKKSIVKIFLYSILFFYCMECYTSIVLASGVKPGVEVRPMEYWISILNAAPTPSCHPVILGLLFHPLFLP